MYCDRSDLPGSTLYITREACYGCLKAIQAAGVARVVTPWHLERPAVDDEPPDWYG